MAAEHFDVAVAGGGPAGSTAATLLARQGYRVVLLERDRFPRPHIGESLLPASLPVLEVLGVHEQVRAAGFLPKPGATMVWGTSREPWTWLFRETNATYPHAYQVVRSTFDEILLRNAEQSGVDVREGCRVTGVDGLDGEPVINFAGEHSGDLDCRFFVDASGQQGLLGRQLNLRVDDESFRNLALYRYFSGGERLTGAAENTILIESFDEGWSWLIPLHTGEVSVGVVVASDRGQETIRELGPEGAFGRYLARADRTPAMLSSAAPVSEVQVVRDWSYAASRFAGESWVMTGDAACFIDPLFSSGVHLALSSGVMAAAYVTTAFKNPGLRDAAAAAYESLYRQQYGHFREMARLFYASNSSVDSYFWEARKITGDELSDPREAFVRAVAGQPPIGYERVVLERGDAPPAFRDAVKSVESERARRIRETGDIQVLRTRAPALEPGLKLEQAAVLGEGQFEPGYLLRRDTGDPGTPVSGVVAAALARADGTSTIEAIAAAVAEGSNREVAATITETVVAAFRILYVDGIVRELRVEA